MGRVLGFIANLGFVRIHFPPFPRVGALAGGVFDWGEGFPPTLP